MDITRQTGNPRTGTATCIFVSDFSAVRVAVCPSVRKVGGIIVGSGQLHDAFLMSQLVHPSLVSRGVRGRLTTSKGEGRIPFSASCA
jgi:hypothetical protein